MGTAGRQAWAIAVVAALSTIAFLLPSGAGPMARPVPLVAAAGSCTASIPSGGFVGQVSIVGGSLAPSALAEVGLNYTYSAHYRTVAVATGKVLRSGCLGFSGATVTGANGSYAIAPVPPRENCTDGQAGWTCTLYSPPTGPVHVTVVGPAPAGYALSEYESAGSLRLSFVYELAAVILTPAGPTVTTSVGAPTAITATVEAANGSASPLSTLLTWSLNGTGWEFVGGTTGATAVVLGSQGAGVARVDLRASAVVDGTALPTISTGVQVIAVPTAIDSGGANRTTLDVGGAVAIQIDASGAAGFPYRAYVQPGLGLAAVPAECTTGIPIAGVVPVSCSALVRYPQAGLAEPTANVSNGYSTAVWTFPELTVSASLVLGIVPTDPVGYAGSPLNVRLVAANGTGARPLGGACLADGMGPPMCASTPGPSWSFDPMFPNAGVYPASGWARDAGGKNASIAFQITIVAPLSLGTLETPLGNASVGVPFALEAAVAGGALPLRFWCNVSGLAAPVASGQIREDGNITATFVPSGAGPIEVSLSVADDLGGVVARTVLLTVGPAPASRLATIVAPPAGPVTAGAPTRLAWAAFDPAGLLDHTFAANATLTLAESPGAILAWVNASAVGPLQASRPGVYRVPASAWVDGTLNVSVTVGSVGMVSVELAGPGLPSVVPSMSLTISSDRAHVRLLDPQVRQADGRTNETLWRVEDRFGNPVPGAEITVELAVADELSDQVVVAFPLSGGGSGVWVNYSAPGTGAGELTVVDAAGQTVLGPVPLPVPGAATPNGVAVDAVATAVPVGAVGLAALAVARRRRRTGGTASEDDLRCLAEGRARVAALVERAGELDLPGLEAIWEPPPAPPALAEWLASLVADGTLRTRVGEDGRPRFCLAPDRPSVPRVTLDPEALARSLRQREDEGDDDPRGDGAP